MPAGTAAKATGQRELASRAAAAGASPRGSPWAGLPFLVPLGPASPAPAPTHCPAPPRDEPGGKTLSQGGLSERAVRTGCQRQNPAVHPSDPDTPRLGLCSPEPGLPA